MNLLPKKIYYYITHKCNLLCNYCYRKSDNNGDELDLLHIADFIRFIKNKDCELRITGGEPTTHKNFKDVIQQLQENAINFTLQTNGYWSDDILNILSGIQNLKIRISPKYYEIDNGRKIYNLIYKNVERLKNSNKSAHIEICFVVTKRSLNKTKNLVRDYKSIGINYFNFIPLYPVVRDQRIIDDVLGGFNDNENFKKLITSLKLKSYYNGYCLAGIEWCNLDFDIIKNQYLMYACSFIGDIYNNYTQDNYCIAGVFDLSTPNQIEDIWQDDEKWAYFRGGEQGVCIYNRAVE